MGDPLHNVQVLLHVFSYHLCNIGDRAVAIVEAVAMQGYLSRTEFACQPKGAELPVLALQPGKLLPPCHGAGGHYPVKRLDGLVGRLRYRSSYLFGRSRKMAVSWVCCQRPNSFSASL